MKKWLVRILVAIVALFAAAFWQLFHSARPPLTIDPATLAGTTAFSISTCSAGDPWSSSATSTAISWSGNTPTAA